MLAAAKATGAILMIDHNQRLVIAHQKARQTQREKRFLCNKILDDCHVAWSH
ncbi:hypothetical protein [Brevibacillus porteri]|uniref:hypothetical protein n=1 Tax=Brevibacillus porteri TaxID=2126350 RepID=UPI003D1D9064